MHPPLYELVNERRSVPASVTTMCMYACEHGRFSDPVCMKGETSIPPCFSMWVKCVDECVGECMGECAGEYVGECVLHFVYLNV